jgi:glyoxylase-like metal-dependent hydrolase (beta-lactamase superfamily II)
MVVEGLVRIPLPTLLPIGAANTYIIPRKDNVMIDTGPNNEYTFDFLVTELRKNDLEITSIDKILITHGHVDHCGLARQISDVSGADVYVHKDDEDLAANFLETIARRKEESQAEMGRCGVPARTVDLIGKFFDFLATMADSTRIAGHLEDGQKIDMGNDVLEVMHTPGHSAGSICLRSSDGTLFSGDTLPKEHTPSVICAGSGSLSAGLGDYYKTLEKLRAIKTTEVLPGHGGPFSDKDEAIDNCLNTMKTREGRIIQALQIDSATPFALMTKVYGPLPTHEIFPGLSEVLGFLDKLVAEGAIEEALEDETRRFSLRS